MRNPKLQIAFVCLVAGLVAAPAAKTQWAVIDAPAILQLIQEVQTMAQQLATAKQQLSQAQQALQTMTGDRGMAQLLNGTVRNYLPSNWAQVTGALQAGGSFPALSGDVQNLMTANAVLSPQRLATLSARRTTARAGQSSVGRYATGAHARSVCKCQQSFHRLAEPGRV